MSVHVSSWVWNYAECQDNELLILLALADYANDEGVCWPGMLSLSRRCRCDVRTVQRNLARAVERGDLEISHQVTDQGGPATNLYRFKRYCRKMEKEGVVATTVPGGGGTIAPPPGGKWQNDEMSPKPSVEPLREPSNQPPKERGVVATSASPSLEGLKLRLGKLFNRRPESRWDEKELKKLKLIVGTPEEEIALIEAYYSKATIIPETQKDIRRMDLQTLLNNFPSEIDRAREFFARTPKKIIGPEPISGDGQLPLVEVHTPEQEAQHKALLQSIRAKAQEMKGV